MVDLRFSFGANWSRFASSISEEPIQYACRSLEALAGDLHGKSFLDVGCGSGIHSLAAARLGANRIHSFDFDQQSVESTRDVKDAFAPDVQWTVERGSVLDRSYLQSLGKFEVVYSWGVLHHTGRLWDALDAVTIPARNLLIISVYNDQGWVSSFWRALKHHYNVSGRLGRRTLELFTFGLTWGRHALANCIRLRPFDTVKNWRNYRVSRGMSPWIDVIDWAGGYPFEVAKPGQIVEFFVQRGFRLIHKNTCGRGHACNEFILQRNQ